MTHGSWSLVSIVGLFDAFPTGSTGSPPVTQCVGAMIQHRRAYNVAFPH